MTIFSDSLEIETTAENIADLSDCKLAAAALEMKFKSTEYDPSFPKGCYSYVNRVQDSEVYWNEHNEGSKHRKAVVSISRESEKIVTS